MELHFRMSGSQYNDLKRHLFPGDGLEAVAVALCGRHVGEEHLLLVHEMTFIPHNECHREADLITWSTGCIRHYFETVNKKDLAIVKIHSHPSNYSSFSSVDDKSDSEFFSSVFGWSDSENPHASIVMLPSGTLFGRAFYSDLSIQTITKIGIVGDEIKSFVKLPIQGNTDFALRTIQAFGEGTFNTLQSMKIGVIGCSGTGSPVVEQLVRLGAGKLVLVDPDNIEKKNLNRILNSTMQDAMTSRPKVEVLTEAIERFGLGTEVKYFHSNLYDNISALKELIRCDVIFGCMDSVDGRYLLNQLCTFYLVPYFDLGVKLEADGKGGISKICCSIHYLQPGKSSLLSRGLYTLDDLKASAQYRKNQSEYDSLKKNGYIKNINVNSPAVISINMQIASHAVNEFLNRVHRFKGDDPSAYACSTIDVSENYIVNQEESTFPVDKYLAKKTGKGDSKPFLEISEINVVS